MRKGLSAMNEITKCLDNTEPRKGWDLLFQIMHENKDDELICPDVFEDDDIGDGST